MTKKVLGVLEKNGIGIPELENMTADELSSLPGVTFARAKRILADVQGRVPEPLPVNYHTDDGIQSSPPDIIPRSVRVKRIYEANK